MIFELISSALPAGCLLAINFHVSFADLDEKKLVTWAKVGNPLHQHHAMASMSPRQQWYVTWVLQYCSKTCEHDVVITWIAYMYLRRPVEERRQLPNTTAVFYYLLLFKWAFQMSKIRHSHWKSRIGQMILELILSPRCLLRTQVEPLCLLRIWARTVECPMMPHVLFSLLF